MLQSNTRHDSQQRVKLVITQKLNEKHLIKSVLYLNLNQAKHLQPKLQPTAILNSNQDLNKAPIQCELISNLDFNLNGNSPICSNITIDLIGELEKIYSRFNLVERIRIADHVQLKVYGLFTHTNEYNLISSDQVKSYYIQLKSYENLGLKHLVSSKNTSLVSLQICNVFEIDTLKLEINFKPSSEDQAEETTTSLDVFTIEIKLANHCFKRDDLSNTQQKLENYQQASGMNYKVHVILPVVLSFFFVSMLIILTVLIRRNQYRKTDEKGYTCKSHISKKITLIFKLKFDLNKSSLLSLFFV